MRLRRERKSLQGQRAGVARGAELAACKTLGIQQANQALPGQRSSKRAHSSYQLLPGHYRRYASRRGHLCWLPARGEGPTFE